MGHVLLVGNAAPTQGSLTLEVLKCKFNCGSAGSGIALASLMTNGTKELIQVLFLRCWLHLGKRKDRSTIGVDEGLINI